jgi:hypothetical protein
MDSRRTPSQSAEMENGERATVSGRGESNSRFQLGKGRTRRRDRGRISFPQLNRYFGSTECDRTCRCLADRCGTTHDSPPLLAKSDVEARPAPGRYGEVDGSQIREPAARQVSHGPALGDGSVSPALVGRERFGPSRWTWNHRRSVSPLVRRRDVAKGWWCGRGFDAGTSSVHTRDTGWRGG